MSSWKKRYFILEEGILSYFEDKNESKNSPNSFGGKSLKGKIDLTGYHINHESKVSNSTGKSILTNGIHLIYDRIYGKGKTMFVTYYYYYCIVVIFNCCFCGCFYPYFFVFYNVEAWLRFSSIMFNINCQHHHYSHHHHPCHHRYDHLGHHCHYSNKHHCHYHNRQ